MGINLRFFIIIFLAVSQTQTLSVQFDCFIAKILINAFVSIYSTPTRDCSRTIARSHRKKTTAKIIWRCSSANQSREKARVEAVIAWKCVAHQLNDTSAALAGDMQPTSSRKKYARGLLLGHGESGKNNFYRFNISHIESSETISNVNHTDAMKHVSWGRECMMKMLPR